MFSEYASRFLQQSNAHLSFSQQGDRSSRSRQPLDRRRQDTNSRYVQRPSMPNPYHQQQQASSQSRFPFAGRLSRQDPQAPLFYSAHGDFEEEDEGDEHEREVEDMYALQRSRQQFGRSHMTESSEMEDDTVEKLERHPEGQGHDRDRSAPRGRTRTSKELPLRDFKSTPGSEASGRDSKGKGRLVDVDLESTMTGDAPESPVNLSPISDLDDRPAPMQTLRSPKQDTQYSAFMPRETDEEALLGMPRPQSPDRESVPPTVILPALEPPKHDAFWATLWQISLFAMFGAFVLTWFHTSAPSSKKPLGDSIYSALRGSTSMLLWDTMIAVIVACVWLSLLRHYVRPLVYTLIVAVPTVLIAFALYPLISSFKGEWHGASIQDKAMRWLSAIPALLAVFWIFSVIKTRHSLAKSISILEFSTRILTASPWLVVLGFGTLAATVTCTWIWMLMFERIFLNGTLVGARKFLLDANAWWLGAFFALQYLWTLGIISGIQRATTAATVSQWYFHRYAPAQPTSEAVVKASFLHATTPLLGTICLSTFLSLLVRLPLIILPGRLSSLLNMCFYALIPTSLATLTNPLTLTYAAIHSQPLSISARNMSTLNFISRTNPSTTLSPSSFSPVGSPTSPLLPYRLAKLLLQATRWLVSIGLGFGGWVRTAHNLQLASESGAGGLKGSLYAYIVALIAGTIGFAVLGAVENVVGATLDAGVVCWGSETAGGRGEARYCREAGEMFGGE